MVKQFTWSEIHDEGDTTPEEIFYYAYYGEEELGFIEWYPKWKRWVWNQNEDIIMSIECLTNVLSKLTWLRQRDYELAHPKPKLICNKCGFMFEHHTEAVRKRNKKEKEPYPCTKFTSTSKVEGKND